MDKSAVTRKNDLPLSWFITNNESARCIAVSLPPGKIKWIALAGVVKTMSLSQFISSNCGNYKIIIRGINPNLADSLEKAGFRKYLVSSEAVLDLTDDHFSKRSLKELIRRGMRHGTVLEVERNIENIRRLEELLAVSPHSKEPQLKNLFYTSFEPEFRLFVFAAESAKWLGALMLSPNCEDKYHTELILRRAHSPVGIMEALVYETCQFLIGEGCQVLSLGEVPFEILPTNRISGWERIIYISGRVLNFAYNSKGLFYFKKKFHPKWANTYICTSVKINLWTVFQLALKTNFAKLTAYKLINRLLYGSYLLTKIAS